MPYSPVEDFASSVYGALLRDLPPVNQRVRDKDAWGKISKGEQGERLRRNRAGDRTAIPMTTQQRRPYAKEISIALFVQNWPTSAMGFPWEGKPERTDAFTIIVSLGDTHAVYFGGRYAYTVEGSLENGRTRQDAAWSAYRQDLDSKELVDCATAVKKYRALKFPRESKETLEE
jgi:hypothetical protein